MNLIVGWVGICYTPKSYEIDSAELLFSAFLLSNFPGPKYDDRRSNYAPGNDA